MTNMQRARQELGLLKGCLDGLWALVKFGSDFTNEGNGIYNGSWWEGKIPLCFDICVLIPIIVLTTRSSNVHVAN